MCWGNWPKLVPAQAGTDKIDARLLALYGQLINPQATPVPAKALAELQELVLGEGLS